MFRAVPSAGVNAKMDVNDILNQSIFLEFHRSQHNHAILLSGALWGGTSLRAS